MKAAQNSMVRDTPVRKYSPATTTSPAPNTKAPPLYPSPPVSARKSPSAVPSVCENMIVAQ
jgi:hypothetical protein